MNATANSAVQPYDALGALLRAAPSGKGLAAATAEQSMAVASHCAWIAAVLKPDDKAQSALRRSCLVYPQDGGSSDVVRGTLPLRGLTVSTASSHYVLCIGVAVPSTQQGVPAEVAANVAKSLFALPANAFVFKEMGGDGAMHYGVRDFSVTKRIDPDWPYWGDALAWWCDGKQATFITTKVFGGATQEVITPGAGQNRYWFSRPAKGGRTR